MIPLFDLFLLVFVGSSVGFDLKEKRIPNWLVLFAALVGIGIHAAKGTAPFLASVLGLGLGIGILFLPFTFGWLGAGDVKFFGAIGSLLGAQFVPRIFFYATMLGVILAIMAIFSQTIDLGGFIKRAWRDVKLLVMSRGQVLPESLNSRSAKGVHTLPFGVAIGLGTLIAFYVDPRGHYAGF